MTSGIQRSGWFSNVFQLFSADFEDRILPWQFGVLKWWYPNSWMVYDGKSIYEWIIWGFLAEVHLFDPFIISLKMFGSKDIQCKQSSTGCTPSRRNGINVPQYQWLEPHMALHISVRKSLHILDHCYCSLLVSNTCPFDTFLVGLKLTYLKPHSMMSVCFIVCCNINSSDRCCCEIPSDSWTGITKCATKYWYQSFYLQKPWPFWIGVWVSSENRESDWSSAEVVYREWKVWLCLKMCITLNRLPFW